MTEAGGVPQPADNSATKRQDPVKVLKLCQAICDACGWHTSIIESTGGGDSAACEWARVHRNSCPLRSAVSS